MDIISELIDKKQQQIELLKKLEVSKEMEGFKYSLELIFVDNNTIGILRNISTGKVIKYDKLSTVKSWLNIRNLLNQTYMLNDTTYQSAKERLKETAKEIKKQFPNDKPLINMTINDTADSICKEGILTECQQNLLHNYACTLHA